MSVLTVIKHTSLATEKFSKNGIQKNVHVIVKNTPFVISLQLNNELDELDRVLNDATGTANSYLDFSRLTVEASLLYDCEQEREVGFIRAKPLDFKCHVGTDRTDQCHIELRIKVLSSQLEDMFFRVRFRTIDSITKEPVPHISVLTDPIKVISKPDQLKKKPKPKKKPQPASKSSPSSDPSIASATVDPGLVQALIRIEQQQAEQQKLLEQLMKKTKKVRRLTASSDSSITETEAPVAAPVPALVQTKQETTDTTSFETVTLCSTPSSAPSEGKEDFDSLFSAFMSIYNSLGNDERPSKIRKIVRNLPSRDVDKLSELLDMFWAEGLHQDLKRGAPSSIDQMFSECSPEDCPHRRELERLDEFYKDFMAPFITSGNDTSF